MDECVFVYVRACVRACVCVSSTNNYGLDFIII